MGSTARSYTRTDLVRYLRPTFEGARLLGRYDVLRALVQGGAPAPLVDLVARSIPFESRMADIRERWDYLPELPVADQQSP